jgi:hypothetical protein
MYERQGHAPFVDGDTVIAESLATKKDAVDITGV